MEIVHLNRTKSDKVQTLGELIYNGKVVAKTIELPWLNNSNRISCIPTGQYKVVRRFTTKHGNHFHVLDVPKRSYILIHSGNYYHNFLGCIGVGYNHADIDKDGYLDVTSSKNKMKELINILPNEFQLIIT
jgi:hypothetical protein